MIRFNEQNEVLRDDSYRAILAGIALDDDIEHSMDELEGLAEADGVEVIGRVIQARQRPENATYLGSGKVVDQSPRAGTSLSGANACLLTLDER